ncbi:MAG: TAXI family TRAP transporter solute-binding subunit, partial [Desulfovibrionales bacterium]|nr:TAXI family TRAP transporter solute-binding subunit [Desulfovibrionales bacterium]
GDVALAGYEGGGKFKGKKHKILSMAIMYPNLLQVVSLKKKGMMNIDQVVGRRISTGSPGSGTHFMADAVLNALGIPATAFSDSRLSFAESANALRDGTIDLGIWCVGPGTSSILDLSITHNISILPFTPDQMAKILLAQSTYSPVEISGGIYRGVEAPVPTIGVWNVMICQASLDTDLVYQLSKALFENRAYLEKIHPSAAYTTPENTVAHAMIPLHPGTIKYLREAGISVPERLIP